MFTIFCKWQFFQSSAEYIYIFLNTLFLLPFLHQKKKKNNQYLAKWKGREIVKNLMAWTQSVQQNKETCWLVW